MGRASAQSWDHLLFSVPTVGLSCLDLSFLQVVVSLGSADCEVVPGTRKGDFPLRRAPCDPCVSSSCCSLFSVPFQTVTEADDRWVPQEKPPHVKTLVKMRRDCYGNLHYQGPFHTPLHRALTTWGAFPLRGSEPLKMARGSASFFPFRP